MSKNSNKMPDLIFVGPAKHRERHVRMVFAIIDLLPNGKPRTLKMIELDETINVTHYPFGFMTAYVPECMTKPNPERLKGESGREVS